MRDLRWIADEYEQAQRVRIEAGERLRAVLQGRDSRAVVPPSPAGDLADASATADATNLAGARATVAGTGMADVSALVDADASTDANDADEAARTSDPFEVPDAAAALAAIRAGKTDGPVPILARTYRRHAEAERDLRRAMLAALDDHPTWTWLSRVKGIGPTLAARLLARLDVHKAPSPSSFWSYCGLATVPGIEYRCADCGLRASFPTRYRVRGPHNEGANGRRCAGRLEPIRGPEDGVRVAQPRPAAGERACYDQLAKKVCYLIGVSFLRSGSAYEKYYRRERAKLARERPGWSDGRIHFAALRKMEKLFLAHLWAVWREGVGLPATTPYAHAVLRHDDYLPPEAMIEPEPQTGSDRDRTENVKPDDRASRPTASDRLRRIS